MTEPTHAIKTAAYKGTVEAKLGRKPRILLIGEEGGGSRVYETMLKRHGFAVIPVPMVSLDRADEAVAFALNPENNIDAVVTDMRFAVNGKNRILFGDKVVAGLKAGGFAGPIVAHSNYYFGGDQSTQQMETALAAAGAHTFYKGDYNKPYFKGMSISEPRIPQALDFLINHFSQPAVATEIA